MPDAAYPAAAELRKKFGFGWHAFKVAGAASAMAIDDIEAELESRKLRSEQLTQMKQNLQAECQEFATDYVMAFRQEVAEFCDQVIDAGGKVHGKDVAGHPPQDRALPRHEHLQRRRHGRPTQRAEEPDLRRNRAKR